MHALSKLVEAKHMRNHRLEEQMRKNMLKFTHTLDTGAQETMNSPQ